MENQRELLNQLRIDRNEAKPPSRLPWILALLVVAALGGSGIWWWLASGPVLVVSPVAAMAPGANADSATAVLQATGYVTARRQATVSAQITGTLAEVLIKAQVNQVSAQLAQARRDLERQQDLVGRKLVSRQAVETAQTDVTSLGAQLAAQQRMVDLAEAQQRSAQVQLDYTTVRAPFSGMVIAKAAQVGEIVSPLSAGGGFTRTGVGTIVDMESLEIEVDVNEAYINRVTPGMQAEAILDAYKEWKIPAHVVAIIPTADRGKATVKVRVGLDQKDARILPDMGARVNFLEEKKPQSANDAPPKGVLLPDSAIVQRDGKSVVFVIKGDRVVQAAVSPGAAMGDLRLAEGIAASTQVVRKPPPELADGSRIQLSE